MMVDPLMAKIPYYNKQQPESLDVYMAYHQQLQNGYNAQLAGSARNMTPEEIDQALGIGRSETKSAKEKEVFGIYGAFRDYIKRHADIIFTTLFVMLLDKWCFDGRLKGTLQSLAEKLIGKAHDEMDKVLPEVKK